MTSAHRFRLPLYLKILGWFFLNVILLAAVGIGLFLVQFRWNLDWLLATGARERIEAARDLLVGELNDTRPDEWDEAIERYSSVYNVRFALFDEESRLLVGDIGPMPPEVMERMRAGPGFPRRGPGRRFGQEDEFSRMPQPPGERPEPLRTLVRTTDPTQYWVLAAVRIDNLRVAGPLRGVLVINFDTISGGGLIFNPGPWIALGVGAVVFSLLFWLPLVSGITRSIGRMTAATRQISEGRFDVRVGMRRRDELGSLAESIDQMAAQIDGLVSGQKRFLGDIAHELCSPVARLQLALGIIEQRATPDQAKFIKSASEKAEQIASLVGELLSFSKASFGASSVKLLPVMVVDAATEAASREAVEGSDVRVEIPRDLAVSADADLLVRALANLLRNAILHAGTTSPIFITAAAEEDGLVAIRVADQGPGVPESELPRIFEPFYRVDAARTRETGGTGLGLTIVKVCVESCCGSVAAQNRSPRGLEITIRLTRATPSAPAEG